MDNTPLVVSFLNRKGGVGKTSATYHLAGHLAHLGHRVLLCDLDPQASLSQGFFGPMAVEQLPKGRTIAALFDDAYDPDPEELIHETQHERLSIVPASEHLTDHNTPRPDESGEQSAVGDFIREVAGHYDAVLLDCPPNLQLCSRAALVASEFVVVPVIPEDFSSQGLIFVQQEIDRVLTRSNPSLRLMGYMLTKCDRRLGIHKAYEKLLREQYGDLVFEHTFPEATSFKEAVTRRCPITVDKPKSAGAEAVAALTREVLERVPVYRARTPEFYYAGNRYEPGVADPQAPKVSVAVEADRIP